MGETAAALARRRVRPVGTTGERHVTIGKHGGYFVRLRVEGVRRSYGTYDTLEDAVAARDAALSEIRSLGVKGSRL